MRFSETGLAGAWLIEPEPAADERGMFARTYCEREFAEHGIPFRVVQCNTSYNARRGTLRGMHYQEGAAAEERLVRCTAGAIYDVVVDLRKESPTRLKWFAAELSAENRSMIFVPKGFAHGFMTLCDGAEVFYQMSQFYEPAAARGVRWNDPRLAIRWPKGEPILSDRDRSYPDLLP
ncbi:MAG TPA: dTDP-4-dehydrorhamnose 3,5-epimerase [Burkholderiales bacterium]|nr:dTDP-4-dehydrorhamnose 3,5-epimerase [Burkholderiales bacterium]